MRIENCALFTLLLSLPGGFPQEVKQPIVYVKHLEPPLRYPPIARATRFQGTILVKVTIGADGTVVALESSPGDSRTVGYTLLKGETEKLVKTWTFACANCSPNVPFEKTIRFIYRLEGDETSKDDTRVVMELPDEVVITSGPPVCDHCPPKRIIK